jgi:exopolyphosphatase/guanosine-5'-triphosphate,3'-diphosphate pyrophosphatase
VRAAAIDIGTNTTLALLAESGPDGLITVKDQLTPNGLGQALAASPVLPYESIALNVDLLNEIMRDYRRDGAEEFAVCGTAALRRAQNSGDFISAVREILHVDVDVLSGRDEAALTFAGAVSNREIYPNERVGVIDIGGGSTEVIEGRGNVPVQSYSLDVGAVYLTNEFFAEDPPPPEAVVALREQLRTRLPGLLAGVSSEHMPWILVGGTPVTLAMMKRGIRHYDPAAIGGTFLTADDVLRSADLFAGRHSEEIQNYPGMPATRGRYIFAGTLLLLELFSALDIQEGLVTERGLRHGFWLAKFGQVRA